MDSLYFDGVDIPFMSVSDESMVLATRDGRIYVADPDLNFEEVTDSFDQLDLQDISTVKMRATNVFFVGTNSRGLIKYDHGMVRHFGEESGFHASKVNGIRENTALEVATENGLYIGQGDSVFQLKDYYLFENVEVRFTEQANLYMTEAVEYCGNIESQDLGFVVYNPSSVTLIKPVNTIEEYISSEVISDATIVTYGVSGFSLSHTVYGSNHGIRASHYSRCGLNREVKIVTDEFGVNEFTELFYRKYDFPNMILISATNGLHYWTNYKDVSRGWFVPEIYSVEELKDYNVYNSTYDIYRNSFWVTTDRGLQQLHIGGIVPKLSTRDVSFRDIDICLGDTILIRGLRHSGVDYRWFKDGELIEGETGESLDVYEYGLYEQEYKNRIDSGRIEVARISEYRTVDARLYFNYNDSVECFNENYFLTIRKNNSNRSDPDLTYRWYRDNQLLQNQTSTSLEIISSGDYFFTAENCNGYIRASDTVHIEVSNLQPAFILNESQNGHYCDGDTLKLANLDGADKIIWSNGRTEFSEFEDKGYFVLSKDMFPDEVLVSDALGCQDQLRVSIEGEDIEDVPDLRLGYDSVLLCQELIYPEHDETNVYWPDGTVSFENSFSEPGRYVITAANKHGVCPIVYDSLFVMDELVYEDHIFTDTTILVYQDTLDLSIDGFYLSRDVLSTPESSFDDVEEEPLYNFLGRSFVAYRAGGYQLMLHYADPYGCHREFEVTIEAINGRQLLQYLNAFPNPAETFIDIEGRVEFVDQISITNMSGEIVGYPVFNARGPNKIRVFLKGNMETGIYFLNIRGLNRSRRVKFMMEN